MNRASGGIDSALIHFVEQYDTKIIGTTVCEDIVLISALDIDKINDYTKEDFTQDEEKFDFIFDALGENTF